ncbi:MAG: Asp-tRNA(Asn)/Glu-tRNA(Gln) amidotransferase subunit GatB [Candidatus Kerfeldbacteria bacterium]|nr:Asp-tRNA(Asn)/Glu-tRNA(Gln) amidotransferase subunit GatB [Candidatus Kerfeldbacteria bacterium]
MNLETVIGLEIHVQLKTKSKMFCSCDNASEGVPPNSLICPICTGHPGTLPVPNKQAIEWSVMAAQALGCTIPEHSKFDRKHYYYPDLPKGYQISQYDEPIGVHGSVAINMNASERAFGITRLHLEEDVGKLFHQGKDTLVDFNRAGTPLMEIVTEPDFRSPPEAKAFLQELRLIMRYLGISNADMEKGELRCDANVSLRPVGENKLYAKTEVKNMNSFRSVERALTYEIERQTKLWETGQRPEHHATRGWDEKKQETIEQRRKEVAADYRYFPEPDIPPMHFTPEFLLKISAETPEIPAARRARLTAMYGLPEGEAARLAEDQELVKYFEEVVSEFREYRDSSHGTARSEGDWDQHKADYAHLIGSWLLNRISGEDRATHGLTVPAADLARLLVMVHEKKITLPVATTVYEQMLETKKGPHQLVKELGLEGQHDVAALEKIVQSVIAEYGAAAEQYRKGKAASLQFLIGKVMAKTKGMAPAGAVAERLKKLLNKS